MFGKRFLIKEAQIVLYNLQLLLFCGSSSNQRQLASMFGSNISYYFFYIIKIT